MAAKLYRLTPAPVYLATFENPNECKRTALLYASFDREDYSVDYGRNKTELIKSYKWIACPKCESRHRFSELADRQKYDHAACLGCGERFIIDWSFSNTTAKPYTY